MSDSVVSGTNGNDQIDGEYTGDPHGDVVDGADGLNDTIDAGGGSDVVSAGDGDDVIIADAAAGSSDVTIIANETFDAGVTGWSNTSTFALNDGDQYMGRFGSNGGQVSTEKTFDLDPTANSMVMEFELRMTDSWDSGEDFFIVINGEQISALDSNLRFSSSDAQTTYTAADGTTYTVDFTFEDYSAQGGGTWSDATYSVRVTADAPPTPLTVGFGSTLNQDASDESFGIDDFVLASTSSTDAIIDGSIAADDSLYGGDGDDTISGGQGADVMEGDTEFTLPGSGPFLYEYYDLDPTGNPLTLEQAGFTENGGRDHAETPTETGYSTTIAAEAYDTADDYALKFTTELTVTNGGDYTFGLNSDDGSMLYVDGVPVVDNDGHHAPIYQDGAINLAPGTYTIEIVFYENNGGNVLEGDISGPDTNGQTIDLEAYGGFSAPGTSTGSAGGDDTFILEDDFGNDTIVGGEEGEDDGGDHVDASAVTDDLTITYTDNEAGTVSDGASTATFSEIEATTAGSGADTVDASATDGGVVASGGGGGDVMTGGTGGDTLIGDAPAEPVVAVSGPNFITNGSFEDVGGASSTSFGFSTTGSIPGWTAASPSDVIDVHNDAQGGTASTDGQNVLDMGGNNSNLQISQTVTGLTDGDTYLLSLDAGDPYGSGLNQMEVYFGGELIGIVDPEPGALQSFDFLVTAGMGDGTDTLTFSETGPQDDVGVRIDSVALQAATINEPAENVTDGADTIDGGAGNDLIFGNGGDDVITGGSGSDTVIGGTGGDAIDVSGSGSTNGGAAGNSSGLPIGQWTFEDAGDPLDDGAALNNSAILQNGATVSNGSVQLDGVDDYVEIPHDPTYDLTNATVKSVFTIDDLSQQTGVFSRDSTGFDGGGHFTMWANPDGSILLRWQSDTTSYEITAPTGTIIEGQEADIQVTFDQDAQTITIFSDGVEVGQGTGIPVTLEGNSEPWVLGGNQWQSGDGVADNIQNHMTGEFSEFEIYEGAFTPTELEDLQASGADVVDGGDDADTITADGGDVVDGGSGGTDADVLVVDDVADVTFTGVDENGNGYNGIVTFNDGSELTFSEIESIIADGSPVNTPPIAQDDNIAVFADDSSAGSDLDGTVLGNDFDPTDATIRVSSVTNGTDTETLNDPFGPTGQPLFIAGDNGGIVQINNGGNVYFDPNGDFDALADGDTATTSVTYTVTDSAGLTDTATLTFTVTGVNDNPDAVDDTASTDFGQSVLVDVLANDSDVDGDALTITDAAVNPAQGTAALENGQIRFTPADGFEGQALIEYIVSDGNGGTSQANLVVTVGPDPRDGLVEGTAGGDLIDVNYTGDPEGDLVDAGDAVLPGDTGDEDRIYADAGNDTVIAGADDDTVFGQDGDDSIEGGAGNDVLDGDDAVSGDDTIFGQAGNDEIIGDGGEDVLLGGADDDTIYAGDDDDYIAGGLDDDSLFGQGGDDRFVLEDGFGNDQIIGGETNEDSGGDTVDASAVTEDLYVEFDSNEAGFIETGTETAVFSEIEAIETGSGSDEVDATGTNAGVTISTGAGDDTITGGEGADSLFGGADDDTFIFGGGGEGIGDTVDGGSLAISGTDYDTLDLTGSVPSGGSLSIAETPSADGTGTDGTVSFFNADGSPAGTLTFTDIENVIPCFTPGTRIKTRRGEVPVEELQVGDRVLTRDNGFQPILWTGQRSLTPEEVATRPEFRPVEIAAGALGSGLPERTMRVSPQHRMLVEGPSAQMLFGTEEVLVAASHMTCVDGISRVSGQAVTYVHILFENHELVLADGAWSESFQPGDHSMAGMDYAARAEILALFPELAERGAAARVYPAARMTVRAKEAPLLFL